MTKDGPARPLPIARQGFGDNDRLTALKRLLTAPVTRVVVAALLLPGLSSLLWVLVTGSAQHFRGWFDVEYMLLLAAALLWPGWPMTLCLLAELTLCLVEPLAHLYYFAPLDAIYSLRYLSFLPAGRLASYLLLLACYIAIALFLLRTLVGTRGPARPRVAAGLVLLALGALAVEGGTGRFARLMKSTAFGSDVRHARICSAPLVSLVLGMTHGWQYSTQQSPRPMASALGLALHTSAASLLVASQSPHLPVRSFAVPQDIVLILVESWGDATDSHMNDALTAPFSAPDLQSRYTVTRGSLPFDGATTSAETRELCGNNEGRRRETSAAALNTCYPSVLGHEGYSTLAVHGFAPSMYSRASWYRDMGFQHAAFLPQLQRDGVHLCDGAFLGACDADVAQWIDQQLAATNRTAPLFVHWVTLNSHLPLSMDASDSVSRDCSALNLHDTALCLWLTRIYRVQRAVARLAQDPQLRPTTFVIVGDHAPPFLRESNRTRFSQSQVPYVILRPRAGAIDP